MERTRVLVVDDERNAVAPLAELLREEGYDVAVAADGVEGLTRAKLFKPHVALIDVNLPRMNGVQLRAELAQLPDPPSAIFLSVRRPPGAVAEDPFLVKPLDLARLFAMLAAMAVRRHGRTS